MKTIAIRLTPKASSNRIGDIRLDEQGNEVLAVYVTAPPDKNKANKALLNLLATHLDVPVSKLSIAQGATNRNKIIQIDD